jgi:GTP pyrophosphokinase
LRHMASCHPERVIPVAWGRTDANGKSTNKDLYAVDIHVEAADRPGLLRDVCDVFAQGKSHVLAMRSQSARDVVTITLTVETADTHKLNPIISKVVQVPGVICAKRR